MRDKNYNFLTDRGIILPVPFFIELIACILILYYSHEILGNKAFILISIFIIVIFIFFSEKQMKAKERQENEGKT